MSKVNVLGIDPSLNHTGLVVMQVDIMTATIDDILHLELVKTENRSGKRVRKNSDDLRRAKETFKRTLKVMQTFDAKLAVSEVPSGSQSARGTMSNGICIGWMACIPRPLIEVSPTEVKLASVGKKTASKNDMIEWAYQRWPNADWIKHGSSKRWNLLTDANEHLADACAAVNAGIETEQFLGMTAILGSAARAA